MGIRALQALKKEQKTEVQTVFIKNLVIGEDLFAIDLLLSLREKYGKENVSLLPLKPLTENDLHLMGPSLLRGEDNIKQFQKLYPDVHINKVDATSSFFKEGSFRDFGGRSKSEKLLWGEEAFVNNRVDLDEKELFPFLKEENVFEKIKESSVDYIPLKIKKAEPADLVEPDYFHITCSNGTQLNVENLYWCYSPQHFLNLYENKNELSDEFIEFCEETKAPSTLYVEFEFESTIAENNETVFLPLSYTHEWGHFIGEFAPMVNSGGKQRAKFMTFIDTDHTNEEEISKKIRLLKRQLEKIYEKFKTISYTEFITLTDKSVCLNFDDSITSNIKKELPRLSFAGLCAPLEHFEKDEVNFEYSSNDLMFLARGVTSLAQIKQSFV
jgi:hypothetical protein